MRHQVALRFMSHLTGTDSYILLSSCCSEKKSLNAISHDSAMGLIRGALDRGVNLVEVGVKIKTQLVFHSTWSTNFDQVTKLLSPPRDPPKHLLANCEADNDSRFYPFHITILYDKYSVFEPKILLQQSFMVHY